MTLEFKLELSADEQRYLLGLARLAVVKSLNGRFAEGDIPPPPGGTLEMELGAFVTLKKHGSLRGCIGNIVGDGPLYLTVARMAQAAAFNDPRFSPVGLHEEDELEYEVSVLGPVEPCLAPDAIVLGRHGLIMRKNGNQGLLLPQVPVEWGWDRETFLRQTCKKAYLPPDEWKNAWADGPDSATKLFWFESVIVEEPPTTT